MSSHFQVSPYDASKLHHDLLLAQKSLTLPLADNLTDDINLHKEAFLQELQNQMAAKSSKQSSPILSTPIAPSPLLPFLPYLQHPYVPMPHDQPTPWNMQLSHEADKKPDMNADTPLNLTKKTKADEHKQQQQQLSNDGNNNTKSHEHHASGSKQQQQQQRMPYNLANDDPDFFAACRLWPVMAAMQNNQAGGGGGNQNMPAMNAQRDAMMMSEGGFGGAMNESMKQQKRGDAGAGMMAEEKVRMVRQQGRSRNSADRDLVGKS
jgi:hypothetical protein